MPYDSAIATRLASTTAIVRPSSAIGSDVTFGVPYRGLKVIRFYRYYVKLCGHVSIFVIS